jgi:NAD(P)-dependent dehydrogenase (short-subunit alcohol dehydrogenase family)
MSEDFAGRVAFVTGAGSGIGRASALAFATRGAFVCVADIDADAADGTVEAIVAGGGEASAQVLDTGDAAQVERAVAAIDERHGRLDFAHNNVGTGAFAPTAELAPEEWDRVIRVTLSGTFYCLRAELGIMLRQGRGAIVNTSAGIGLLGLPRFAAYATAKAAVNTLTQVAALDHSAAGVRINAVCPGQTDTPRLAHLSAAEREQLGAMQAIPRLGRPEEIAAAVTWLCSEEASFVTGALIPVDGGYTAGKAAAPN